MTELVLGINASAARRGAREFARSADSVRREARSTTSRVSRMSGAFSRVTASVFSLKGALAGLGAGFALRAVIQETARFEQQLVEVGKTTGIQGERLDDLGSRIQRIASELPVATTELQGLAVAAGQLGVSGVDNVEAFTETLGKLQLATDIVGEEGARSLARLLNITGESNDKIENLGSAITALGNNFATTESEISRTTTFLASATSQFGVSAQEVLGMSAALRSLGQRAETSGSSVGAAMQSINTAIAEGGETMQMLSRLTGKTADTLEREFADNATGVLLDFAGALRDIPAAEQARVLDELGLAGRETSRVINALASGNEEVRRAVNLSNESWRENNALNREAAQATDTLAADIQLLKNAVSELFTQEDGMPAFRESIQDITETIKDREFQRGFDSFVAGMAKLSQWSVQAAAALGKISSFGEQLQFGSDRANLFKTDTLEGVNSELDRLRGNLDQIENSRAGEALGDPDLIRQQIRMLEARRDLLQRNKEETDSLNESSVNMDSVMTEINAQLQFLAGHSADATSGLTDLQEAFGLTADAAKELDSAANRNVGAQGGFNSMFDRFLTEGAERDIEGNRGGAFGNLGGEDQTEAMRNASRMMDRLDRQMEDMNRTGRDLGMTFTSAFEDAVIEGENFRNVLDGIVEDIARIVLRKNVTEPAAKAIAGFDWSSLFSGTTSSMGAGTGSSPAMASSADGNVFTSPSVTSISERGHAEAVLPLERQGGKLGVRSSGGGGGNTYVNIENNGPEEAEVSRSSSGRDEFINVVIGAASAGIQQGKLDGPLTKRFQGIKPRTAGRG